MIVIRMYLMPTFHRFADLLDFKFDFRKQIVRDPKRRGRLSVIRYDEAGAHIDLLCSGFVFRHKIRNAAEKRS